MLGAKRGEIGHTSHRAVGVHDFADHTSGCAASELRNINRGLSLPRALEHATWAGAQREDVARHLNVGRTLRGVNSDPAGVGTIGSGDARRNALARLDRDRKGRLVGRHVVRNHRLQAKFVAALGRQSQTDQTARMRRHKVDVVSSDELGRHAEVALILAVWRIDNDDHFATSNILDGVFDWAERSFRRVHQIPC